MCSDSGAQYAAGKVVCLDCHGPIALTNCKKPDGEPLVKGLKVTGFTDAEETAVGLAEKVNSCHSHDDEKAYLLNS